MGHPEPTFVKSQSHREPHGTNPLLGRYLEEDVGRLGEQPIIPKPSKPMFAKKNGEAIKRETPNPMELNRIFQEYSTLDPEVRRDEF